MPADLVTIQRFIEITLLFMAVLRPKYKTSLFHRGDAAIKFLRAQHREDSRRPFAAPTKRLYCVKSVYKKTSQYHPRY
jgi:hypothetical protein